MDPAKIGLNHDVQLQEAPGALLLARAIEQGIPHVRIDGWATLGKSLLELGEPVLRVATEWHETGLFELDGALVEIGLGHGHIQVAAAGDSDEQLRAVIDGLRERFPTPEPTVTHDVTVTFWTYGPQGPQQSWRAIAVPGWDDINANYSEPTRAKLERLMRHFEPAHGGQLILWHGQAGTGKTFGLRALAWEWRDWCEFHYIVDPDSFFGEHADYLMGVLLQPDYVDMGFRGMRSVVVSSGWASYSADIGAELGEDGENGSKPWRVLVLEDTGELLSADAKARMGQGLSRFLNVVDGLIGQGLRVLVLVTTNEQIRSLHPAVARPGRCAANVHFEPLDAAEASRWLTEQGLEERVDEPTTIAALYARLHGLDPGEIELADFEP